MATQYIDQAADGGRGFTYTQNASGKYDSTDVFGRPIASNVDLPPGLNPGAVQTQQTTNTWVGPDGVSHAPTAPGAIPGGTAGDVVPTSTHRDASGNLIYTGADGLKHDQNGNTYNNGTVTPKQTTTYDTPNGQAPAQTTQQQTQTQQTQQPTQQPQQTQQTTPTMPWAPGHTGADVKALQDMLVSKGFMTSAEVATGPGIFGPKTQAALAKYQMQNGAPATTSQDTLGGSSSTATSTYTNQPATPTTPAKSAVQQVIDDYTTAYQSLGLGDIKAQYQKFVQDQTDLTNKQNDEKAAIDNNPWMTQGIKDNTKAQIDKKYETRQNTLTHQIELLDSLYKQGQQEVNNIVSKAESITMEQQKEAADLAQRQLDAANALILAKAKESPTDKYGTGSIGEYNFAKSQGYTGSFTQYQNEDANRKAKASGGSSAPKTLAERNAQSLADLQTSIDKGNKTPSGAPLTWTDGNLTADGLRYLIAQAPSHGLTSNDVIKAVANQIATDSNKNPLPSYGLTGPQIKLVTGALP
jgi:hypothetical protein